MEYIMSFGIQFFFNSIFLGVGLAMDAFSVSVANGLREPDMPRKRMAVTAGTFALFQTAMPLIGWICVCTAASRFMLFAEAVPWIALLLLGYIGIKMILDSLKKEEEEETIKATGIRLLLIQGFATSIDALSVGFTVSDYKFLMAFSACAIIGLVTFIICLFGVTIGKKAGTRLTDKSGIVGGIILILIGLEIFIKNMFFQG